MSKTKSKPLARLARKLKTNQSTKSIRVNRQSQRTQTFRLKNLTIRIKLTKCIRLCFVILTITHATLEANIVPSIYSRLSKTLIYKQLLNKFVNSPINPNASKKKSCLSINSQRQIAASWRIVMILRWLNSIRMIRRKKNNSKITKKKVIKTKFKLTKIRIPNRK